MTDFHISAIDIMSRSDGGEISVSKKNMPPA